MCVCLCFPHFRWLLLLLFNYSNHSFSKFTWLKTRGKSDSMLNKSWQWIFWWPSVCFFFVHIGIVCYWIGKFTWFKLLSHQEFCDGYKWKESKWVVCTHPFKFVSFCVCSISQWDACVCLPMFSYKWYDVISDWSCAIDKQVFRTFKKNPLIDKWTNDIWHIENFDNTLELKMAINWMENQR